MGVVAPIHLASFRHGSCRFDVYYFSLPLSKANRMTKLKLLFFCLCFNLIGVDAKLEANKSIPKSSSEVKKSNKGALMNLFKKKMKRKDAQVLRST